MNKTRLFGGPALALAVLPILSGCGGPAGAQSARQAFTTTSLAAGMLTGLRFNASPGTAISSAVPGFSGRPGQSGLTLRAQGRVGIEAAVCGYGVTPALASKVDVDGDGIPLIRTWTYDYDSDACGLTTGGTRWKYKGSYLEQDLDDTKKWMTGGFSTTWDFTGSSTYAGGTSGSGKVIPAATYSYTGKGSYSGKTAGATFVHQSDYNGMTTWSQGSRSGSYTYLGTFKHVVTPDTFTDNDAWKKGKIDIGGTWSYSGQIPDDEQSSSSSASSTSSTSSTTDIVFTAKSKNLTYDSSCSSFWSGGSFIYDVGNGHTFEFRYSCTGVKYYYDGVEYDPTKP